MRHNHLQSYNDGRYTAIIQDIFNKYQWYYNLKEKGDSRIGTPLSGQLLMNNEFELISEHQGNTISGVLCIEGVEYPFKAILNKKKKGYKGLFLAEYYDDNPDGNKTIYRYVGGSPLGNYMAITNSTGGVGMPVIAVRFQNAGDYDKVVSWFHKYKIHY